MAASEKIMFDVFYVFDNMSENNETFIIYIVHFAIITRFVEGD